jgi:FkbM family methyltransferase
MKIEIPRNINSLRIDVGASTTAPNTYNWIRDIDDCFVIIVEPVLKNITTSSELMNYNANFKNTYFIHAAVDNVEEPEEGLIYVTKENIGCSSLYLPQQHEIEHEEKVTKVSLKYILDKIDWKSVNFDYIEYFKTDTQGNEINVLKSMKEYLNKIAILEIECTTWDEYHDTPKEDEVLSFLEENNFEFLKNCEDSWRPDYGMYVDRLFINKNFLYLKDEVQTEFAPDDRRIALSPPEGGLQRSVDVNSFAIAVGGQMVQQQKDLKINNYYTFKDTD